MNMPDAQTDTMCPSSKCAQSWQRHFDYYTLGIRVCTTCGRVSNIKKTGSVKL